MSVRLKTTNEKIATILGQLICLLLYYRDRWNKQKVVIISLVSVFLISVASHSTGTAISSESVADEIMSHT